MAMLKHLPAFLAELLVRSGVSKYLSAFYKMAPRSLTEVVNGLTENKDLRAVFSYIFGTYGRPLVLFTALHCIVYFNRTTLNNNVSDDIVVTQPRGALACPPVW